MSEEKIVAVVNEALACAGVQDTVTAAGGFEPRGHSGAGFAGGLIGGDIGDAIGSPVGGIGAAGGYLAGTRAHDAASGLPERMVVGVSETTVYGFAGNRAHPQALVFRVPREGLEAKVTVAGRATPRSCSAGIDGQELLDVLHSAQPARSASVAAGANRTRRGRDHGSDIPRDGLAPGRGPYSGP